MSTSSHPTMASRPRPRLGFGWSLLVAMLVFMASLWYLAPAPLREWPIPTGSVIIGYFGNGAYLATVAQKDGDQALSYWDASTGRLVRHITSLTHPLYKRDFSPDGRYLAHVVRENETWQLRITNLLNDQQDQPLIIPLRESMQKKTKGAVYLGPAWSSDSQRLMFRQDVVKQQTACLWDIQNRKLIFQQPSGIYIDPNIIVRFSATKNNYVVFSAATGLLIGELPVLATESEFEFSALPDGSAFMVIGSSTQPPKLIKYQFDLKTKQLSTLWEKNYGKENHHIAYETSLRPPYYFLFHLDESTYKLIHADDGKEQFLPKNLPLPWTEKPGNSVSYVSASMGKGSGLIAVDGQGMRIISKDGRYLLYQTAEPANTLLTKFKAWARNKLGVKFDSSISIVQVDLHQENHLQYIDFNHPGPGTLILAPDSSSISLIDIRNHQFYLRQWTVPFPTYPWLLLLVIACSVGLVARFCPVVFRRRPASGKLHRTDA